MLDVAGDRLIAFAGAGATPGTNQNDVAVLSNVSGSASPSVWTTLSPLPPLPSPREFLGAAYDAAQNAMFVFGGKKVTSLSPAVIEDYNDMWVLTHANGTGGTPTWTQLAPAGTPPASRSFHSVTYDATRHRLIVFGGEHWDPMTQVSQDLSDLWVLMDADGVGGTPTWAQLTSSGIPPSLPGPTAAALDLANDQLIVVGAAQDFAIHVWVRSAPLPVELEGFVIQ